MPSEVNASLTQQGLLGQLREYQIQNGVQLKITIGSKQRHKAYQVHLLALDARSRVRLHIAWPWFWCLLVSLLGIPGYFMLKKHLGFAAGIHEFAIFALLSLGILLGLVMLILKFSWRRVFYSRMARVPLLDILINRPDKRTYKRFLAELLANLKNTRERQELNTGQQIAGEVRMLRRLASEGVISQGDYERARDKLLKVSN